MHGIIFKELKTFVVEHHGRDAWYDLTGDVETARQTYLPVQRYPDEELVALVEGAAELTDTPVPDLLEAFGEYLADTLLDLYDAQVDDEWGYFDLVEQTEEQIHTAIRAGGDEETPEPPAIAATREGPERLTVHYSSDRQLCDVATGLLEGLATAFEEEVAVREPRCMLDGADECRLVVEGA